MGNAPSTRPSLSFALRRFRATDVFCPLQTHFGVDDDEARRLIREALVRGRGGVDLYRFTSVLCAQLDQDGRKQIIEMLWEIAMADLIVHEYEVEPRRASG